MMKKIIYLYFVAVLLFSSSTCQEEKSCEQTYSFEIPFTLSPALDTFRIGDTIWLESIIPNFFEDKNTGELIDVTDFIFTIRAYPVRMDTIGYIDAEPYFDIIDYEGEYRIKYSGRIHALIIHEDFENEKRYKTAFIPKNKGLFTFSFGNLTSDLVDVDLDNTNCKTNLEINYNMNDGANNNFDLQTTSPNDAGTLEGFTKGGGYTFWVIE